MLAPWIAAIVPPYGFHRLFWNNYPATAFDHDLSNAVEAALLFISIDSFLRDPKGLTCITLHFFTDFSEVFTSDTVIGRLSCRPRFRKPIDEGEPAEDVLRKIQVLPFFWIRQVTSPSMTTTGASRSWTGSQRSKAKEAGLDRMAQLPEGIFPCSMFRYLLISDGMLNMSISKHSNIVIKLRMPVSLAASVRDSTKCRTSLSVTMRDSRFIVVIQTRIL
jgi:hypothetical protein